jgi:hypothetical protein
MGVAVSHGLDGFEVEAEGQAAYLDSRSPCHAVFLRHSATLVATDQEVRKGILAAWEGRSFRARYERPLLLCAAVRFDALRDSAHPLSTGLAREPPEMGGITVDAVREALTRPSALVSMRNRFVQTNEVTRACVWRLPITIVGQGRPIVLADLGCSAGLNLIADRLNLTWARSDGAPLELQPARIVGRIGFDRAPVDVRDEDAVGWLRACLWPGQTERLRRFEQAVRCARDAIAGGDMQMEAVDATEMPARLERLTLADRMVFAYQTVVLDYLLPAIRDRYQAAMSDWLVAHPHDCVWAEFERSKAPAGGPAEIRVHFATSGRPTVRTLTLAHGEYHPEALSVNAGALAELAAHFQTRQNA